MTFEKIILLSVCLFFVTENTFSQGLWLKKLQFGIGTSMAMHDLEVVEQGGKGYVTSGFNNSWGIFSLKWRHPIKKSWYVNGGINYGNDYFRYSIYLDDQFYPEHNFATTHKQSWTVTYMDFLLGIEKVFRFKKLQFSSQAHLSISGTSNNMVTGNIIYISDSYDPVTFYELNGTFGRSKSFSRLQVNFGPTFFMGSHKLNVTLFSSLNLRGRSLANGEYELFDGTSIVSSGMIKSKVHKVGLEVVFFFRTKSELMDLQK